MPYLTPEELPEEGVCRPLLIPASTDWLAIVSGALDELTKAYNWEQFGSVTVEEAVARMQLMMDQYYADACGVCELPEGGGILRLNDEYQIEQLIDGVWATPETIYIIPPPPERTDPTSEERICLAARNAANMLEQYYEEITDAFTLGLTVLEAIVTVAAFVGAAVVAPLGLAVAALGAIAYGVFKIGYEAVEFVSSDFWDADFTENFTCALIRCATDTAGVITFDFDCVNTELLNQIEWLDPTLSSFTLAAQVRWILAQLGSDGLNAMGGTTEITDPDCGFCSDIWCYAEDLTDTAGEFVPAYGSAWSSGTGWERGCVALFGVLALDLPLGGDFTLNNFSLEVDVVLGSDPGSVGVPYVIQVLKDSVVVGSAGGTTIGGNYFISWDGDLTLIDAVHVEVVCSRTVCDGQVNGISFSARGEGALPFDWTNNC